jgi:hypothetical protein
MKIVKREHKKNIKEDGLPAFMGPKNAHNITVVYPRGEFSSVSSVSKREGSITCTRKDSHPLYVGMGPYIGM